MTEEVKDLPFAAVWAEFRAREDRPTGQALMGALDRYQGSVAGRGGGPSLTPPRRCDFLGAAMCGGDDGEAWRDVVSGG